MTNTTIKSEEEIKSKRNYELSFWLSSALDDVHLEKTLEEIKGLITKLKGEIGLNQLPQLKQLAYPIKKERNGYFGYFQFTISPDAIKELKESLDKNSLLLRYLIIHIPEVNKQTPNKTHSRINIDKTLKESSEYFKSSTPQKESSTSKKTSEVDMKDLDKKLNEILK